jgi:hypothetical protein
VIASRRGVFVVGFSHVTYDRCNDGLTAFAVGSLGSRVVLKAQPLCPPN